jgi:hypothetical protein
MGLYEDSTVHIRVADLTEGTASGSIAAMMMSTARSKRTGRGRGTVMMSTARSKRTGRGRGTVMMYTATTAVKRVRFQKLYVSL